jgi:hypothetical protein
MFILMMVLMIFISPHVFSQSMNDLHGDQQNMLSGLHNGNNVQSSFYNDGMFGGRGVRGATADFNGEWPKGSGYIYFVKIVFMIGAEVRVVNGDIQTIISESHGSVTAGEQYQGVGDNNPLNPSEWWTNTPLPGFANYEAINDPELNLTQNSIAMSHLPWSWPGLWPDKLEDMTDPGWGGQWNSYFAKGWEFANADQESYFVLDDYQNREFEFYPDSTNLLRRGLGMRVQVRGMQWNNPLVRDVLFVIQDVTNIGTHNHNKVIFIEMPNYTLGVTTKTVTGAEGDDDVGNFDKDENFLYFYDSDDRGYFNFDVGMSGYALFETPGNPKDGIDNDGDGKYGSGILIEETLFESKQVNVGDDIIVLDYTTYERSVESMPDDTVKVLFQGVQRSIAWPGKILEEVAFDNIDNNLNGLIDENNGALSDTTEIAETKYVYVGRLAVDYFSGTGSANPLIDERRDNEIDDDGDWDFVTDDIGIDGTPGTKDFGEGDGMPTSGYQNGEDTGLPGEPNIDKTDIDESDLIGMTSFHMQSPYNTIKLSDDEGLWGITIPGTVYAPQDVIWVDAVIPYMGSGYFPLNSKETERFSGAFIFADGPPSDVLYRVKSNAETAYKEDYHFFRAPNKPIVKAVAGDGRVTLYWDSQAERSRDPIAGLDFEGYRIYRSTDPQWKDMKQITNAYGTVIYQEPLVIFDLNNGINGLSTGAVEGVRYYLGDDSGLQHSWVDTSVYNGITYYYAVVSFDRGVDSLVT